MKRRVRIWSAVFAVVCVIVSGVVLKVTDQAAGEFYKVRGDINQPVQLNDATVTVQRVTAGQYVGDTRGEKKTKSAGLFVALDVLVVCPASCPSAPDKVMLHAGDRTYKVWNLGILTNPPPGYQTQNRMVFEIDPADLGKLVAEVSQTEIISGYQAHGWIDLHLEGRADQLRREAKGKTISDSYGSTEVIP